MYPVTNFLFFGIFIYIAIIFMLFMSLKELFIACACMCIYVGGCAHDMACVSMSEYNWGKLVVSLYYVGLYDLSWVVRLGD